MLEVHRRRAHRLAPCRDPNPAGSGSNKIRAHGADPFAYFEWVFEKLMHNPPAEELESLLPVHWLKARAAESAPIDVEAEAVASMP